MVEVPELKVVTQGDSPEDAMVMIADAIEGYVDVDSFKVKITQTQQQKFRFAFTVDSNDPVLLSAFKESRQAGRM